MKKLNRVNGRNARCPKIESLENRQLLTITLGAPQPAGVVATAPVAAFDSIIGASALRSTYGVDGTGLTVAVIDTGVNYNHEALGGGFGAGKKVIGGYDFAMSDADPFATTWEHGTAVAGLIASSDPAHLGVAPGADIVALRVFGDDNQGDYTRIADSMQWVLDHHNNYNISVVNLSISDGQNYRQNIFAGDGGIGQRITQLIAKLKAVNIPVVSATGNSFTGEQGEGFTAIDPNTISVTSTDGASKLAANAQRLGGADGTDVAAPGTGLTAPIEGNSFQSVDGTSFAAALVSGSVVLLQSIYFKQFGVLPTVNQVEGWLRSGADAISDPITGITIGRLDLPQSAALIPTASKATPPVVIPVVITSPVMIALPVTIVAAAPVKVVTTPVKVVIPVKVTAPQVVTTPVTTTATTTTTTPVASKRETAPVVTTWSTWITNLGGAMKSWRTWTATPAVKPGVSQPAGSVPKPLGKVVQNHHPKALRFARVGATARAAAKVA